MTGLRASPGDGMLFLHRAGRTQQPLELTECLELCFKPTAVSLSHHDIAKWVKVDPAPTAGHKIPFELKLYSCLTYLFAFLQYQEVPLGTLPALAQIRC